MHGVTSMMLGTSVVVAKKERANLFADAPHDIDPLHLIHQPTRMERCAVSQA